MRLVRHPVAACLLLLLVNSWAWAEPRVAWTTSQIVGSPDPPPPYRVELAYPQITFRHPVDLAFAPANDRVFVVEQDGKIYSFVNSPDCAQLDLAIDFRQVYPELTATYALTFDPNFEHNRFVYVCYVIGTDKPDGSFVSRFTMANTVPPTIDPASEKVLIRWWSGGHNGCCLKFGPDGYLYISTGDGGAPAPPDPLMAGQDVSNLLSAILRIDVHQEEVGRAYRVPPDNPLIGIEGARPEIWSYGYRNPWRMSFDRATGDLWVGDVGWQLWEMIYRVERGGNYGWPIMEGPQPVLPEAKRGPTPILPPTISHPHSEASSITGGYVYRGQRFPELEGVYIYGDFQTGTLWGLRHDGEQVTWHKVLAHTPLQLVCFAEDRAGEVYLLDYERSQQIYHLMPNASDGQHAAFPRRLSETGLFSSVEQQTPAPGVISYAIHAMQWADYTTSQRWMAVPGTDALPVAADGTLQFPDGSVLVKTVSIEMQRGAPQSLRRLETQILHREQGSWRPYTYVWNEQQTDAQLVEASGLDLPLKIVDDSAPGGVREQNYRIASRTECQMCHNPWVETKTTVYGVQTASPLATSTGQLNCSVEYQGSVVSQWELLQQHGWLSPNPSVNPTSTTVFVNPYDDAAEINARARSYLHVNCSHCHQPHAGGAATIELTIGTRLEDAQMLDVRPAQGAFGISDARIIAPGDPLGSVMHYRMAKLGGGRMPRVGSNEVDVRGVALIYDWIAQMPPAGSQPAAGGMRAEDQQAIEALRSTAPEARRSAIQQLTSSTRGALALLRLADRGELSAETRGEVIAVANQHSQTEIRDLFERFVPPSERVARLGSLVNSAELLALSGDAERGRELFFRDGASSCKSCHRVGGTGETLGPDLSQIGKKYQRHELLTHLLEPSKFMEPQYIPRVLETADGRVLTGLLIEQNEREVVLKDAQQEHRVPAEEVELLVAQQKSIMPELLLRDLTPQQAADLLEYLSALR